MILKLNPLLSCLACHSFLLKPRNICRLFAYSSDVHTYNTRFSDTGNFYINKSRLSVRLNSFSAFGAKVWNCLKPDLCKLKVSIPFLQFSLLVIYIFLDVLVLSAL